MLPWEPPVDEPNDLPTAKETEEKENLWLTKGVKTLIKHLMRLILLM